MINGENLNRMQSDRQLLRIFGGINETYGCSEAEWESAMNFSSRGFPALQTRLPRKEWESSMQVGGMYHLNGLVVATRKEIDYYPTDTPDQVRRYPDKLTLGEKIMVGMGSKVIIFPDKVSFDTTTGTVETLEKAWDGTGKNVMVCPCTAEGVTCEVERYGKTEPTDPKPGEKFLKVKDETNPWKYDGVVEVYDKEAKSWKELVMDHCLVTTTSEKDMIGIFEAEDVVELKNFDTPDQWKELDGYREVKKSWRNSIVVSATPAGWDYYGTLTVNETGGKWVSADGKVRKERTLKTTKPVQMKRTVPDLDFVTENNNRLWGCNRKENTIYASALGDPKNWYRYQGTAADSYTVNVGSDGHFTGAAGCMGYVLFFKENCIHRLYGTKPSDYQMASMQCRGVAENGGGSTCVVNQTLYYLADGGVMAWDGGVPVRVSASLDENRLRDVDWCSSGQENGKLHLAMGWKNGLRRMLVYDTERGLWHEETDPPRKVLGTGGMLYLWNDETGVMWTEEPELTVTAAGTVKLEQMESEAVSGDIGMGLAEDKYFNRVTLRVDALGQSVLEVAVSYDGGVWETAGRCVVEESYQRINLPLVPRRYDTLRLRLKVQGQLTVRSIALSIAGSSGNRTVFAKSGR